MKRPFLAVPLALIGACIIPDREIATETVPGNPGAVRIVEPTNLTPQLLADCKDGESTACPQVPSGRRSGLVTFEGPEGPLPLCICPIGSHDNRSIDEFYIYAEDPDRSRRRPADDLFAVALLDLDPQTTSPQNFVAYEEQFEVGGIGQPFELDALDASELAEVDLNENDDESLLAPSLAREDNGLFRFRFGKNNGEGTDLCNDDSGAKLTPGMHTLQIMVTDRPFFRPQLRDAMGEVVLDLDGRPQLAPPQNGMPDIAAGATWTIANYVFECIVEEADIADDDSICDCTEVGVP